MKHEMSLVGIWKRDRLSIKTEEVREPTRTELLGDFSFGNFFADVEVQRAEVRPSGRATFVSVKVTKTSDAPSGRIGWDGRELRKSGPTRGA